MITFRSCGFKSRLRHHRVFRASTEALFHVSSVYDIGRALHAGGCDARAVCSRARSGRGRCAIFGRHLIWESFLGVIRTQGPFSGDISPCLRLLAENCRPKMRFASECRPTTVPVSESCPRNELRVRKLPNNAARIRMSPERGVSARSPSRSEPFARIPLENPKAGETR